MNCSILDQGMAILLKTCAESLVSLRLDQATFNTESIELLYKALYPRRRDARLKHLVLRGCGLGFERVLPWEDLFETEEEVGLSPEELSPRANGDGPRGEDDTPLRAGVGGAPSGGGAGEKIFPPKDEENSASMTVSSGMGGNPGRGGPLSTELTDTTVSRSVVFDELKGLGASVEPIAEDEPLEEMSSAMADFIGNRERAIFAGLGATSYHQNQIDQYATASSLAQTSSSAKSSSAGGFYRKSPPKAPKVSPFVQQQARRLSDDSTVGIAAEPRSYPARDARGMESASDVDLEEVLSPLGGGSSKPSTPMKRVSRML